MVDHDFPPLGSRHLDQESVLWADSLEKTWILAQDAKNKGVAPGRPAHHIAVAAGQLAHLFQVARLSQITVAKDGDGQSLLDLADDLPVSLALVILVPGPGVDGDHGDTSRLQGLGHIPGMDGLCRQAGPDLGRDRFGIGGCRLDRSGGDGLGQGEIAHQGTAGPLPRQLGHRTPHVEINEGHPPIEGIRQKPVNGKGKVFRIMSEELNGPGLVGQGRLQVTGRPFEAGIVTDPLGGHQLGHGEGGSFPGSNGPESGRGKTSHRGQADRFLVKKAQKTLPASIRFFREGFFRSSHLASGLGRPL